MYAIRSYYETAIALPFIVLYEVGIIVARLFGKKPDADEEEPNGQK